MTDSQWAVAAVDALLAKCLRAVAVRLQQGSDAVLTELLRRWRV